MMRVACLAALTLLGVVPVARGAVVEREFRYGAERVAISWRADTAQVSFRGGARELTAGLPDLPVTAERIELPHGMRVRAVSVVDVEREVVAPRARVLPAIVARPGFGPFQRSQPDPARWQRPAEVVALGHQGSMRGRDLAYLTVRPVAWDPSSGRLERISRVRVRLELEPDPDPDVLVRERVVGDWERGGAIIGAGPATLAGPRPQPFRPTQIPSLMGSPVAYVIITSDALAAEFQRLADWKTQAGTPAVVRTLSFIRQQYPDGVDDADRIRRFIRDAYTRWGTAWVLLGGDTEVIPTRVVWSTYCFQDLCDPPEQHDIPSDYYFACLDGNWNADGDAFFGEGTGSNGVPVDKCDLLPEVYVGRAPVATVADAQRFIDKTLQYQKTPVGDYEHRLLFFAEVLFPQNWSQGMGTTFDGAEVAEACLPPIQTIPALRYARLYENHLDPRWQPGAIQLTRARVRDSLNVGYNLGVHVGHGFRNVMSCGDANFTNADALTLTNGSRLTNTYLANCTSNAIDFPCLGEALMQAAAGGSVTNIGSSRVDFPLVGQELQVEYFRLLYEDSVSAVGEVQELQRIPWIPYSTADNVYRWTLTTLLLLGDPELRIWTGKPRTLSVSHPATLTADVSTVNVTVQFAGQPLAGARVTLLKNGDEYRIATTNASGVAVLDFRPDGTGSATLTVTGYDCRPYQATIPINATSLPVLGDQAPVIDDDNASGTSGNGNLIMEAGEVIDLRVPARNQGGTSASAVTGTLTTTDPLVTVVTPSNGYGSIAAGAVANGTGWFRVSTPYTFPDQREIPFTLTLVDGAARTWIERFSIVVRSPEPRHLAHSITEVSGGNGNGRPDPGETVDYFPRLRNLGTGVGGGVVAVLRSTNGLAVITDSVSTFGTMAAGAEIIGDAFRFSVTGAGAVLQLRISTSQGLLHTQTLDLTWPAVPSGVTARGRTGGIELSWTPSPEPDLMGYMLVRSTNPIGPYLKVNQVPSDRSSYYYDVGLTPLTRYYYQVSAVDSSGNVSAPTAAVAAGTNPPTHPLFPIPMGVAGSNTPASVAVARIFQPGKMDVLSGADKLYVWHSDGTAPRDADQSGATSGDYSTAGDYFAAGPSVGDLDGGGLEIVAPTWNNTAVYAFDLQGQIKPGWPVVTPDPVFSNAAIGDLDGDGNREVAFGTNGNRLYVVRSNGTEWMDGDSNPATLGVFKVLGSLYNYGTPAIVDLDLNGQRDILYGGFDGWLYAWRPNGASLPGFPILVGGSIASSVAVGHLDGTADTQLDIVVSSGGTDDSLYVFTATGARRPGFPVALRTSGGYAKQPSPALADIDGDGFRDIVAAGTDGRLYVWNRNGVLLPAFTNVRFSILTIAATESSPVVADIDGNGGPDIVIGDDDGTLSAFGHTGAPLAGFPIRIGAEVKGTPALCDCDGDGLSEVVVTGWDAVTHVWDYDFAFSPSQVPPWPQFHHDAMRTGYASSETVVTVPPPGLPTVIQLGVPVPNPARATMRIDYDIPAASAGKSLVVEIFDLGGRRVRRLVDRSASAGQFAVDWDLRGADGQRMNAGVYLIRLRVGDESLSRRAAVLP